MSFILDALRKSESERQRDAGAALARVPLAATRPAVPIWVRVLLVLLTGAVLVLGGGWWRSMRGAGAGLETSTSTGPATGAARAPGEDVRGAAVGAARGIDTPDAASARAGFSVFPEGAGAPPAVNVVPELEGPAPSRSGTEAVASTTVPAPPAAALPGQTSTPTLSGARPAPSGGAASTAGASAPSGAAGAGAIPTPRVRGAVPTMAEVVASGVALPPLTLELHVYHDDPSNRFVFINGGRYVEGQRLRDGPTLVEIRPLGVVLNQSGRNFLLLQQ